MRLNNPVLRLPEVIALTGLSKTTIYELSKSDDSSFPKPFKIAKRASVWYLHELEDYLTACASQRKEATHEQG